MSVANKIKCMWCQSIVEDEDLHKDMVGVYSCFKKDIDKSINKPVVSQDKPVIPDKNQSNNALLIITHIFDSLL